MKKISFVILIVAISFLSGFAVKTLFTSKNEKQERKKVTGIGGFFFKCKDSGKLKDWYSKHLGLNTNEYGAVFETRPAQ